MEGKAKVNFAVLEWNEGVNINSWFLIFVQIGKCRLVYLCELVCTPQLASCPQPRPGSSDSQEQRAHLVPRSWF